MGRRGSRCRLQGFWLRFLEDGAALHWDGGALGGAGFVGKVPFGTILTHVPWRASAGAQRQVKRHIWRSESGQGWRREDGSRQYEGL